MLSHFTTTAAQVSTPIAALQHFSNIARFLLNNCVVRAGNRTFHLREVEFYYKDQAAHPDLFTHSDPIQSEMGRWYFHRTNGEYRGGTYKGLDITFGDGQAFAGILIRGLQPDDGDHIDGPCLSVDQILRDTQQESVAALDALIARRPIWDTASPLHIAPSTAPSDAPIYRTARIGLTLKRCPAKGGPHLDYLLRPYRFLNSPATTKKGKIHLAAALHRQNNSEADIQRITRSPRKTIQNWLTLYNQGLLSGDLLSYRGKDLTPEDLSTMHGIWTRTFGHSFVSEPASI